MTDRLALFLLVWGALIGSVPLTAAAVSTPVKKSGQVLRKPASTTPVPDKNGNVDLQTESLPDEPTENSPTGVGEIETDDQDIFAADKDSQSRTQEMTKDIVNETENPEPEFPYPGATEEGFGNKAKTRQAQQPQLQGPPTELTKPIRMNSNGEYFYGFKSSEKDAASSIRFGHFSPPLITNPENNKTFIDIYGKNQVPTLFFDYEWMLTRKLGDVGIKVTTGLFYSQGEGEFAVVDEDNRKDKRPDEEFKFLMMPNLVSFVYRFQYFRKQFMVPFIDGGGGYFTFVELRDDGGKPKFGGVPVLAAAAGINFQLDWFDTHAIRQLDSEWGINHVWLTTEFRQIKATDEEKDVSSSVISAGIMMEF